MNPCLTCSETGCDGHADMAWWVLRYEARPWTTNAERAASHWVRAKLTREWREAFGWLARAERLPPLAWASIIAQPSQKGGRLQDAGGCAPAVKAAVDGIVDAGVLPDDSPEYVKALTYLRPLRGEPALTLWIAGQPM